MPDHHGHAAPIDAALLRSRGRRLTRQRALIWEAIVSRGDEHLSADEVVELVRSQLPTLNPSTVYRNLEMLVEEGVVLRTDLGGDRAFYEPAREHRHHHIVCERCGAIVHFHDSVLGDLPARVEAASGYALGVAEVSLFGLCPDCRSRE